MKCKNIDLVASYYYITATFTKRLPVLNRPGVHQVVCDDISEAHGEARY